MNSTTYLTIIIAIILGQLALTLIVNLLNFYHKRDTPKNLSIKKDYVKAKRYLKSKIKLTITKAIFDVGLLLIIIFTKSLNTLDIIIRSLTQNSILAGLIFFGVIGLVVFILEIPFSLYSTFVIEKKYGFNKMTGKTFIVDILKTILGYIIIGAVGLSIILFLFNKTGGLAWLYCWIAVTLIQIFTLFIYPIFILPIYNKLKILKDGPLKDAIQKYLIKQNINIKMSNIKIIDSSKRTNKSNAFLTGIGRNKRLVLSDTLIKNHSINEIISIVAHEIGHLKGIHILKKLGIHVAESFLMFFLLSILIQNSNFFLAFGVENLSVYMGLILFSIIYSPMALFFSIITNYYSREFEYVADLYARETTSCKAMSSALNKLGAYNLTNPTPHSLKVFLSYSHPPIKDRIRRLKY